MRRKWERAADAASNKLVPSNMLLKMLATFRSAPAQMLPLALVYPSLPRSFDLTSRLWNNLLWLWVYDWV